MLLVYVIGVCLVGGIQGALEKPADCGSSLGCYSDCDSTCKFVVTWKENGANIDFTLALTLDTDSDQWIALGLSDDQEMGSDSVTECVRNGDTVEVRKSYNAAKNNVPISDSTDGLSNTQGSVTGGVLRCSYTQTQTTTNQQIVSLIDDWYLLVANGVASNGFKSQHSVETLPLTSPNKADFQSTDDITGTATPVLVKIHGSVMMFAWIFCASIGIVLARHYKPIWPNSELMGERPWFTLHRSLMVFALIACIAGFVLIFIDVRGWSELPGATNWQKAHPIIGVVVTALVVINPLLAACRPHPDHKHRFIFNWAHWLVGTCAQIISAIVMIIGVTIARASVPFYCVWILVAWVVYQIFMELILEIFDCCFYDKRKYYYKDGSIKNPRGSVFKKFMLGLHVIIITAFTIAAIVVVIIH